jgi:hypothetical protein
MLDWLGRIALAGVVVLGLWVGRPMVDDLAGKDTKVNFVGQLGWGTTVAAGAGWANESRRRKAAERRSAKGIPKDLPIPSSLPKEVDR